MSTVMRDAGKVEMAVCPTCAHDLRARDDGKIVCSNRGCTHYTKPLVLGDRCSAFEK